jgi:alkanesulfonate monooxygenase SsuD/methylene tetrahydromethanopterin reductase-like flavin-dependent oxidoreductase (luciferase family)
VAEETAWLAARHPGRVGLGVAAGALPLDYQVMGSEQASAAARFAAELPRLVAMLQGRGLGPLAGDPALRSCMDHPVPVLSAAVSATAARRAAIAGAGILMEGMSDPERLSRLTASFDEAGGAGAKVLIRRVWVGALPAELVERQRQFYDGVTGDPAAFGADQTVVADDGSALADRLAAAVRTVGATSLDLRVHLPGVPPDAVRRQIVELGRVVVPRLHAIWPGVDPLAPTADGPQREP